MALDSNSPILILGYGPVGRASTELLSASARDVRVAQRRKPADLGPQIPFLALDALDRAALIAAAKGIGQIVVALGFPYFGKIWREVWPRAMDNVLAAAEASGARVVFVDNLYMLGPQSAPLTEDMPLRDYGVKPAVRAAITRQWMAASEAGRVRFAALRAPDFYGPGVGNSHLGDLAFGALAKGKGAQFAVSVDQPHDVAYVPDFARGVVSLLDAPDDCFGQAWNLPCADPHFARDFRARRRRARAARKNDGVAALDPRTAGPFYADFGRIARNAVSMGPTLPRRRLQIRQALLVGRDAV